jgi:predicted RNA-binding Zn-ribbon protein involved in translation (DUF1610 family)
MYTLTLVLFAFFSLVLPILAVPVPLPVDIIGLEKRTTFNGKVRVIYSYTAHDIDLSARRQPGITLTVPLVVVVKLINSSSLFPRNSLVILPFAGRCNTSLRSNMIRINASLQEVLITSGEKSVEGVVVDSCPSCGEYQIGGCHNIGKSTSFKFPLIGFSSLADLSPAAFEKLAPLSKGEIDVKWNII